MSVDFIAYFHLAPDYGGPHALREKLDRSDPAMQAVIERYRSLWTPQVWTVEEDTKRGTGHWNVIGPGGFWIELMPRMAHIYHCVRFDMLQWDPEHQRLMRRACFSIANLLGSDRTTYVDEMVDRFIKYPDDATLAGIEKHMLETLGPPAASIAEIDTLYDATNWTTHGPVYYVDRFEDLRAESAGG